MEYSRRDLSFILPALAVAANASAQNGVLPSKICPFGDLPVRADLHEGDAEVVEPPEGLQGHRPGVPEDDHALEAGHRTWEQALPAIGADPGFHEEVAALDGNPEAIAGESEDAVPEVHRPTAFSAQLVSRPWSGTFTVSHLISPPYRLSPRGIRSAVFRARR